jgi:hypothetical protein
LALAPQHDDLRGKLEAEAPLFLWPGRAEFSPADKGARLTAWAIDFDPHAPVDVVDLPAAFDRVGRDLRRRLARRTGPVLAPLRGQPLTLDAVGWIKSEDYDRDPDEPDPDHVCGRVTAVIDGDTVPDDYDDLMTAVKAVGHYVASAFNGPDSYRDETCPGTPPRPGRVESSWYATHLSLLAELKEAGDV